MPLLSPVFVSFFFFCNDTAPPEIYTLSLHDALPIWIPPLERELAADGVGDVRVPAEPVPGGQRSEEHTSELQSHLNLVCRLLLEKKTQNAHLTRTHSTAALRHCSLV